MSGQIPRPRSERGRAAQDLAVHRSRRRIGAESARAATHQKSECYGSDSATLDARDGKTRILRAVTLAVELESPARAELDDRVVGADAAAIIAFEAGAAGEAPARLAERVGPVPADHLFEAFHPTQTGYRAANPMPYGAIRRVIS